MSTVAYIQRLNALKEGERSRLRSLAGQPLDTRLDGFDLFTGLWWPLRQASPVAPRREPSWLVAKLFGAFGSEVPQFVPEGRNVGPTLPAVLGVCEPRDEHGQKRFRQRVDTLLCTPLPALEPHLRWALGEVAKAMQGRTSHARGLTGIDWARLLDDLSIWDRGEEHRRRRDVRDEWAEAYLNAAERTHQQQGA
ncbi:MAG: type I-E CRISPR-associated protein Cse2/CasB [Phycisphaeraceae bacterium]|nr:type I-E CRISPR-associated protein Cse2/CasB [Phycisphaeraceae bacterium]